MSDAQFELSDGAASRIKRLLVLRKIIEDLQDQHAKLLRVSLVAFIAMDVVALVTQSLLIIFLLLISFTALLVVLMMDIVHDVMASWIYRKIDAIMDEEMPYEDS